MHGIAPTCPSIQFRFSKVNHSISLFEGEPINIAYRTIECPDLTIHDRFNVPKPSSEAKYLHFVANRSVFTASRSMFCRSPRSLPFPILIGSMHAVPVRAWERRHPAGSELDLAARMAALPGVSPRYFSDS
jgi:hypothetical protein